MTLEGMEIYKIYLIIEKLKEKENIKKIQKIQVKKKTITIVAGADGWYQEFNFKREDK